MREAKPHCREGESESTVALAWALFMSGCCVVGLGLTLWSMFVT